MIIRPETQNDIELIRDVNFRAFGRTEEADIVDMLRDNGKSVLSFVAEHKGQVAGHIMFSVVTISSDPNYKDAVGLGPIAVVPEHQRKGIGGVLVRGALIQCKELGFELVFVLGDPGFFGMFGFETASRYGFSCVYDAPNEAFMVIELVPGALRNKRGLVEYADEFNVSEAV